MFETSITITILSVSLLLPRAHADTNASLTRKVFHLRVNKLIASSAVSLQCAAQLVPAPQESLPHIFEIVTRAETAQSLSTPGTEPVQPFLQPRPRGPQPLRISLLDVPFFFLIVLLSLCNSPGREDLASGPGPKS